MNDPQPPPKWDTRDIPDLNGRVVVITGANSGLGLSSARALASHGATVVMACRSPERSREPLESVAAVATGAEPMLVTLDLADLDAVREAAAEIDEAVPRVDVLMNNAGVMATPLRRTAQGHELQFGTNHLGHFALTGLLLPALMRAEAPRVVTTSSLAHRIGSIRWDDLDWHRRYQRWPAYGQTKLANLLFAYELDRQAREHRTELRSMAAHPGYAATHLQEAGPRMSGRQLTARIMQFGNRVFAQSADMGALPQLYAATAPEAVGGTYYGPGGLGEQRGHPARVSSSAASRRVEDWRRLWERSEELTGITYPWPER